MLILRFLAILFVVVFASGCAEQPMNVEMRASVNAPYRLASGDRLRVIVFGQESLSNVFNVDGDGNIAMPLIGTVHLLGLTTSEAAQMIETRLRTNYLRDPKVAVEVITFRPFFVLGEVGTAGQYPFVDGLTVRTAVAIAGGFSLRADQSSVEITRMIHGHSVTSSVPLSFPIHPGDTLTVHERFF